MIVNEFFFKHNNYCFQHLSIKMRNKEDYQLTNSRSAFAQNSLFYKGLQMFNDFKKVSGDEYQRWRKEKIKHEITEYVKI